MSEIQRWLYQGMANGMKEAGGPYSILALMGLAFLFGSVHALMPGHGKSVLVSFHLSQPGRMVNGILNGFLLVLTHVGSAVVLVLAGIAIIRTTLGPSRQTQTLEIASAAIVVIIGLWLLWRALRSYDHHRRSGPILALVTGLVPCPLTTFIMTYSVVNGLIALGLLVVTAMALGMVATIGGFAIAAVLTRDRMTTFLDRSILWRARTAQGLEVMGASGVVLIGLVGLGRPF